MPVEFHTTWLRLPYVVCHNAATATTLATSTKLPTIKITTREVCLSESNTTSFAVCTKNQPEGGSNVYFTKCCDETTKECTDVAAGVECATEIAANDHACCTGTGMHTIFQVSLFTLITLCKQTIQQLKWMESKVKRTFFHVKLWECQSKHTLLHKFTSVTNPHKTRETECLPHG